MDPEISVFYEPTLELVDIIIIIVIISAIGITGAIVSVIIIKRYKNKKLPD